jgi:hypothetical protein
MSQKQKQAFAELAQVLNEISIHVITAIRIDGLEKVLDYNQENTYRTSFKRIAIQQHLLEPWAERIDIEAMAVEVIWTLDDEAELHVHKKAFAVLTTLGLQEGIEEPKGSKIYFQDEVYNAASGITLQVPPNTKHGFGTPTGAHSVVFLSVQSKKINDDFHVVE